MNRYDSLAATAEEVRALYDRLLQLRQSLDDSFFAELNRSLPFADVLFDRWHRGKSLGFGKGTSVYDSCHIFGNVTVGENTWIGPFTVLDGSGGLAIGSNCSISAGVQIYSHDSVKWAISGGKDPYSYAATTVGDNCYVGPNAIISKGVTIGEGCIIGTNSFVNTSFPAGSKIGGSPAKSLNK